MHGKEDHKFWNQAKNKAKEEGHAKNWSYVTSIYKALNGDKVASCAKCSRPTRCGRCGGKLA